MPNWMRDNRFMSTNTIERAKYHLECEGYEDESKAVAQLQAELAEVKALAQAVVEDDKRGPAPQIQQHLIDALAKRLEAEQVNEKLEKEE